MKVIAFKKYKPFHIKNGGTTVSRQNESRCICSVQVILNKLFFSFRCKRVKKAVKCYFDHPFFGWCPSTMCFHLQIGVKKNITIGICLIYICLGLHNMLLIQNRQVNRWFVENRKMNKKLEKIILPASLVLKGTRIIKIIKSHFSSVFLLWMNNIKLHVLIFRKEISNVIGLLEDQQKRSFVIKLLTESYLCN